MAVIPVHLSKLFRPLDPKVLRPWLIDECPALDADALWQAPTRKAVRDQVLPVLTAHLAPAEVRRLDQNAERVALVADRAGREAWDYCRATLVDRLGADWVTVVEGGGNGYFRALALLRADPRLFTQVEGVRATDELRGGRLYSGFRVPRPHSLHLRDRVGRSHRPRHRSGNMLAPGATTRTPAVAARSSRSAAAVSETGSWQRGSNIARRAVSRDADLHLCLPGNRPTANQICRSEVGRTRCW